MSFFFSLQDHIGNHHIIFTLENQLKNIQGKLFHF